MARDARETKMHYSPSEKDGVFVVEVARGADSGVCNGKLSIDNLISKKNQIADSCSRPTSTTKSISSNASFHRRDEIQVHQPPADGTSDDELLTVDEYGAVSMASQRINGKSDERMLPPCGNTNTGLSQSDLSISSSCGSNQGYTYGAQQHYTIDSKGYQTYSPHTIFDELSPKNDISLSSPNPPISNTIAKANFKPTIMAAIYKQESVDPGSSYPEDGRPGKLRTDKNALLMQSPQPSAIVNSNCTAPGGGKEEVLNEEQRLLGNGILTAIDESSNGDPSIDADSGPFDSLLNLPAPPTIDEIKQLNDITLLDNNNMDSLPPPPPPDESQNCES